MTTTAGQLFRRALRDHWRAYAFGLGALFLTDLTDVMVPKFVQWSVDTFSGQRGSSTIPGLFLRPDPRNTLQMLVIGLVTTLLAAIAGRIWWRIMLARQSHVATYDLKIRLWDVLRHAPLKVFHKHPLGDLMNRAIGDLNQARNIFGFSYALTFDCVFYAVLAIGAMVWIDPLLTLMCLTVTPFMPRPVILLARRERDQHNFAQESLSDLSNTISQSISTIRLQRATAGEEIWSKRLIAEAREYAVRRFAAMKTQSRLFPIGAIPTVFAYGILLFLGVRRIQSGHLTIGQFIAMQSYVVMLQVPLFELGEVIAEWQRGFASLSRITEIFNLAAEQPKATDTAARPRSELPTKAFATIDIRNLSFVYPESTRRILDGLELHVTAGEWIGIMGAIGTGKTTLLNSIAGIVDCPMGSVFVEGRDVATASRPWLVDHVGVVTQKPFLFAGSVRMNLCLNEEIPDARLWDVLDIVRMADDVKRLSHGLDSWIGEWGVNLSGGQKQRLSLARVLLRDRPLLLFDDCVSAVDAITEEVILGGIARHCQGRTLLWVAHRRSTLKCCQRILVLEGGRLRPATARDEQEDDA